MKKTLVQFAVLANALLVTMPALAGNGVVNRLQKNTSDPHLHDVTAIIAEAYSKDRCDFKETKDQGDGSVFTVKALINGNAFAMHQDPTGGTSGGVVIRYPDGTVSVKRDAPRAGKTLRNPNTYQPEGLMIQFAYSFESQARQLCNQASAVASTTQPTLNLDKDPVLGLILK